MSYVFTANNDDYNFKKVDGILLSFPNNGQKWSLMKTPNNKYSWIPANDLSGLNINTYKFVNNQITIDSCLFIIITFKINNIAYYANTEVKPTLKVSNNTDTIEYKLQSYIEDNQLFIPFKSNTTTTIKLLEDSETLAPSYSETLAPSYSETLAPSYNETLAPSYNEFIELIDCYVFNI